MPGIQRTTLASLLVLLASAMFGSAADGQIVDLDECAPSAPVLTGGASADAEMVEAFGFLLNEYGRMLEAMGVVLAGKGTAGRTAAESLHDSAESLLRAAEAMRKLSGSSASDRSPVQSRAIPPAVRLRLVGAGADVPAEAASPCGGEGVPCAR